MPIKKPNLFIVGAPKCGTTSLYRYLNEHPDVYMCPNKEPCFWASEFTSIHYPNNEDDYLALFSGAEQQQWVGEATTTYLYSETAAKRIRAFSPEARILIMLRDPVEMIYSLHQQRLFEGAEDLECFEAALDAEADRNAGRRLPKGLESPVAYLQYRSIGLYAQQVARYLERFKRSRIHVIFFEDLIGDSSACFSRVCQFLDIPTIKLARAEAYNPGKSWKSLALRDLIMSEPARFLKRKIPRVVRKNLKGWVLQEKKREPMAAELSAELRAFFKADIQDLMKLLGQDLRWG